MLNIRVGKETVKIPQSYREIPLNQFCVIWKILDKYKLKEAVEGEELTDDEVIDNASKEYDMTIDLVGHLLGMSKEEVKGISYEKATEVVNAFNHIVQNENLKDLFDKKKNHFIWKGEAYYFPKLDFEDMKFGEYAELMQMQKIYGSTPSARFDFINKQLALSCRMFKEEKDSYNVEERQKLFEDITMDKVMQWTFFLTNLTEVYSKNIQTFTPKTDKAIADTTKEQNISLMDMVGLTPSTNSQKKESLQKQTNTMQ